MKDCFSVFTARIGDLGADCSNCDCKKLDDAMHLLEFGALLFQPGVKSSRFDFVVKGFRLSSEDAIEENLWHGYHTSDFLKLLLHRSIPRLIEFVKLVNSHFHSSTSQVRQAALRMGSV